MTHLFSRRGLLGTGLGVGLAAGMGTPARAEPAASGTPVAILDTTVIDGTGAPPKRRMTVVVDGGRITAVGPSRETRVPGTAAVVDGRRRFVIPGLVDMHVHSSGDEAIDPPLYLANGVTTVREMSGHPALHEWRRRVDAGTLLGPRSVIASPILDGSPSLWAGRGVPYLDVADAGEARAAVKRAAVDGADFVKVYTRLSAESYAAIADETRRVGLDFAGHCPDDVPVTVASDVGQRTFEHLFTVWCSTSADEDEIRRALRAIRIEPGDAAGWFRAIHPLALRAARTFDDRRAAQVFHRLARNDSHLTPTLTMHRVVDLPASVDTDDERLRYVPAEVRAAWEAGLHRDERAAQETAELFGHRLRFVRAAAAAEVPLLAGTDTGSAYCYPGFSLHDELELLVRAGLSPMCVLRAATRDPMQCLGLGSGTVRPGGLADLVVLDADPLRDIRNTRRVHAVITRGALIDAARRDAMLAEVEQAARSSSTVIHSCPCG
ncbi:amidohydrolase family protein [Dactylosporangium sp. AC04546]|uniref:amidohydrolase family protein n=1 Tax=Dactylosporangium sp. AC04546 TaxID=2862460 RepID=UPI001EDCDC68|nr:amidohydrolase family protein [Dactylosporangium sp. AC04546]WVK83661.1 amidohydrolase family protein [Dactylosporangium sp. AC04546]